MSFQPAIDLALAKLREQEAQVAKIKKTINGMLELAEQPPMFLDADAPPSTASGGFRSDQFYGQSLTGVVRDILNARKSSSLGAASVTQIYEAMLSGGFKFETANPDNAKRVLRISLTKNSATFHKLPNGDYGLREWYPSIKESKPKVAPNEVPTALDGEEFEFEEKEKSADEPTAASA